MTAASLFRRLRPDFVFGLVVIRVIRQRIGRQSIVGLYLFFYFKGHIILPRHGPSVY